MCPQLRVLIVEDRENDALLMLRELRRAGFEAVWKRVAARQAFLAAIQQEVWDIILADYSLPQYSGVEALAAARDLIPDIPFVIVSGAIGEETAVATMKAGADDFVLKQSLSRLGPVVARELRDVSVQRARRQAEQKLKERDALFRSVIENVSDLIFILDREGGIRYHSPSVSRVLGYGPDELIGKSVLDYLPPEQRDDALQGLATPERSLQEAPLISCQVRRYDGSWSVLEGTATNLLADPIVAGIVCNFRDVTVQRQSQRQLARAQRMESIGNLAGGIAHDLNNMLTPILVAAEMLQEDLPPPDRDSLLQGLTTGAHRAADLVHQLLSLAKGFRADRGNAQVAELVRETERLLRFGIPKSISIQTTLPSGLWPVQIGASELAQVLMNLCVNARDAMPRGGRLSISAMNVTVGPEDREMFTRATPGQYVVLNVVDTGVGIPPEIQEQIFEPFFTTKGNEGGTGLGLSTTWRIVHDLGGFINMYSQVDQGTRFAVYIPAAVSTDVPATTPQSWPTGHGELILVIDDQAAIREIVKETLEAHQYRVVLANDGAVGLLLYRDHPDAFDLVIIDVTNPALDGPATIDAIRKLNPDARIILQAGFMSEQSRSLLNVQTAEAFLEKPYTTGELLHSVHDSLHPKSE